MNIINNYISKDEGKYVDFYFEIKITQIYTNY